MRFLIWLAVSLTQLTLAQRISTSARCGPDFGLTCKGSRYGDCCSQYSYCGSTDGYCGKGCQEGFGTCKGSASSIRVSSTPPVKTTTPVPSANTSPTRIASSAAPASTLKVTTNARCGSAYDASPKGQTCQGSKYGNCCSQYSYCGSTDAYCGQGCQSLFGSCKPVSSSVRLSSSTSRTSSAVSSSASNSRTSTTSSASSSLSSSGASTSTSVILSSSTSRSSTVSSSISASSSAISSTSSSAMPTPSSSSVSSTLSTTLSGIPAVVTSSSPVASSCAAQITNIVKNGQFNNGNSNPWTATTDQFLSPGVTTGTGHDDSTYFSFFTDYPTGANGALSQTLQTIPAGTVVDCYAWIATARYDSGSTRIQLSLNNQRCGGESISGDKTWTRMGSRITLSADVTELRITVGADGSGGRESYEVLVDDVSVLPVSGPGLPRCSNAAVSSSTLSATLSSALSSTSASSSTPLTSSSTTLSSSSTSLVAPLASSSSPASSPSAAACNPKANYITNGQFASFVGWTEAGDVSYRDLPSEGGHNDGPYYEYGSGGSRLTQIVGIPAGTEVSCSAWAQILVEYEQPRTFEMLIDG
ncbi:hypothetical protein CC86DRAFT_468803, partial [Ophiobolus disseminans]